MPRQDHYDTDPEGARGLTHPPRSSVGRKPRNLGASVRTRLQQIAEQSHRDFDAVLLQYFQERLLYRVSISRHASTFILKGALLLLAHHMTRFRPTRDIDFLGQGVTNDPEKVRGIIQEIARIPAEDAVVFKAESVRVETIAEQAEYEGVRVKLEASMDGARHTMQVDIAFGDEVVGGPLPMEFPTLLDMAPPFLRVYSVESAIAEKFQALVKLNVFSSRMKDIYDILHFSQTCVFKREVLREALARTFSRRGTSLEDRGAVFSPEFASDRERRSQWHAFLRRARSVETPDFPDAMARIAQFLDPVCDPHFKTMDAIWDPEQGQWGPAP